MLFLPSDASDGLIGLGTFQSVLALQRRALLDTTRGSDTALVVYLLSSDACGSIIHVVRSNRLLFACVREQSSLQYLASFLAITDCSRGSLADIGPLPADSSSQQWSLAGWMAAMWSLAKVRDARAHLPARTSFCLVLLTIPPLVQEAAASGFCEDLSCLLCQCIASTSADQYPGMECLLLLWCPATIAVSSMYEVGLA